MANNKQIGNRQHSFYREQQKSILGQQQWTPKRVMKLITTILKWCLWGFLIIATLWGCVNEFIIQTSNNLGQGVEFYQKDDFVYPNTYQGFNLTGYTSTEEAVEEGTITHGDVATKGDTFVDSPTTPFDFYIMNPTLLDEEATIADYNNDRIFVDAVGYVEAGGEVSAMYYNLNFLTFTATNGASYRTDENFIDGKWVGSLKFSTELAEALDLGYKEGDEELGYEVNSTVSLAFYLLDAISGTADGKVSKADLDVDWIKWSESDETNGRDYYIRKDAISVNGKLTPISPSTLTVSGVKDKANWTVIEPFRTSYELDENGDIDTDPAKVETTLNNQIQSETNIYAFNNGTGRAVTTKDEGYTGDAPVYLDIVTDQGKTVREIYDAEYMRLTGSTTAPVWKEYEADFTQLAPDGKTVYGGAQTMVTTIQKGYPARINEESQALIDGQNGEGGWRESDFQGWDTSKSKHQNQGFDVENQMYGWTLLDATTADDQQKVSVMRLFDSAEAAANATNETYLEGANEGNSFYADQRRLGWGLISEDSTYTGNNGEFQNEVGSTYSVFDEKMKAWMNEGSKYARMQSTINVGEQEYTYTYGTKFAGMTSVEQYAYGFDGEDASGFYGVTPMMVNDGGIETERSIFSDSIIPTRQDAWGESRITFIGWEDWGKAWDVQYGPLYGAFVFPLAQLAMFIGEIFAYMVTPWGVIASIIVIVFLTRGLGALLSLKGTSNQMKMQEVQTDVAKIKAKYSKYDLKAEPRMKQKQQMEIMALYRKKEINPMGSLGTIFITMPIFISLWIIISALPAYKVVFMGNFSWAVSSWYGIFNMGWLFILYLFVGISVGLVQGISSKLPTWLSNKRKGIKRIDEATKEAQKKQNKTQNIMIGVFVFMGLTVPALFAFYWICSGFFTIVLELIKHAWKVHVANEMKKDTNYQTPMARFTAKFKKA